MYILIEHTIAVVVFKLDIYTVNVVDSTQIYLPRHRPGTHVKSCAYYICSHTRRFVSIDCITSMITRAQSGV